MSAFDSYIPVDIQFGSGKIHETGEWIKHIGKRAFIITGRTSPKTNGVLDKIKESCHKSQVEFVVYEHSTNEPSVRFADDAAQIARIDQPDVVVGIGGGVILDLAKAIALGKSNASSVWNYTLASDQPSKPSSDTLPIITIPTTAGSGSEVSPFTFLVHQEKKIKSMITSRYIFPKITICDPQLTLSLNQTNTAYSGFSLFVRALENFISRQANPLSNLYSKEAIRLVHWNLERAFEDGNDLEAREKLLWADVLAGLSNTLVGTGIAHAVAYPLSANYKVPHGLALANVLPGVIRFLKEEKIEKLREISYLLTIDTSEMKFADAVDRTLDAIEKLIFNLGLKRPLKEYAVDYEKFQDLASIVVRQISPAIGRDTSERDVERITNIYKEAF